MKYTEFSLLRDRQKKLLTIIDLIFFYQNVQTNIAVKTNAINLE